MSRYSALGLAVAVFCMLGGCTQAVKPMPAAVYDNAHPAYHELDPALQSIDADILFVTDRVQEVDVYGHEIFGTTRSASLAYGNAVVRLDVVKSWQELVAWTESSPDAPTGSLASELVSVDVRGRFPQTPYLFEIDDLGKSRLLPEIEREVAQVQARTGELLRERLRLTPDKSVHIYVHGIRTHFEPFLIEVAQDWHFSGRLGVPIAYSWPAGADGLLSSYARDRESGEFTVPHLKQVIRTISNIEEVEALHLYAHSRGSDVVMSAVRELFLEGRAAEVNLRETFKIANIMLLAPDLDMEVAEQRFGETGAGSAVGRITVYSNLDDTAIGASQKLFSSRARLGSLEQEALTERQSELIRRSVNVDFVIYTGGGGGEFRHSYWRSPAVRADGVLVVRDGLEPGSENGRPLKPLGNNFWELDDDYLR